MEHVNHLAHSYLHHGFDHHDNHHHLDELLLAGQIGAGFNQTQSEIHTASINNLKETSDAARDTVDSVRDAIDATNNIGHINLQSTERNGGESRSTTERAAGVVRDMINATANQASRDHGTIVGEICDVRKEMSDGFGETKLELAKGQLEQCKQHNELARLVEAKAAEAARQLAECCCKLEGEHAATRALILSTDNKRVEQENANLRQELLLAKINSNGPGQGN